MPTTPHLNAPTAPPRRHDLDSLRAFAMLIGVALHAALAFAPIPWLAMNRETSPMLLPFFEVIHGFRLPLFFLMSGFFSGMLLQRRGAAGFMNHRWKRIGLPLLIGAATIVPAIRRTTFISRASVSASAAMTDRKRFINNRGMEKLSGMQEPRWGLQLGGVKVKRSVKRANRKFGIIGINQNRNLDFRGRDDINIDILGGQGLEHGLGDPGMRLHADPDDRDFGDIARDIHFVE